MVAKQHTKSTDTGSNLLVAMLSWANQGCVKTTACIPIPVVGQFPLLFRLETPSFALLLVPKFLNHA